MSMSNSVEDLLRRKRQAEKETDFDPGEEPDDMEAPEEIPLNLLGIVWNVCRDGNKRKEIVKYRYQLDENIVVERGIDSFWLYGFDDELERAIKLFHDNFSHEIRKYKFIRPESEKDTFLFYYFKDAITCRYDVLISSLPHEIDRHKVIIKDVIEDIKNDIDSMDSVNKAYFSGHLNHWIQEKLIKNTHLGM